MFKLQITIILAILLNFVAPQAFAHSSTYNIKKEFIVATTFERIEAAYGGDAEGVCADVMTYNLYLTLLNSDMENEFKTSFYKDLGIVARNYTFIADDVVGDLMTACASGDIEQIISSGIALQSKIALERVGN